MRIDVSQGSDSPGRVIHTLDELQLLLGIYRNQGLWDQALEVLDSPYIGITSPVGQNSWELMRIKIELLELCHKSEELQGLCEKILTDAKEINLEDPNYKPNFSFGKLGDDWKIWAALLFVARNTLESRSVSWEKSFPTKSCGQMAPDSGQHFQPVLNLGQELTFISFAERTNGLVDSMASQRYKSRNAQLAKIQMASLVKNDDGECLHRSFVNYFRGYCTKNACFLDLQPLLRLFPMEQYDRLLLETSKVTDELTPKLGDPEVRHRTPAGDKRTNTGLGKIPSRMPLIFAPAR